MVVQIQVEHTSTTTVVPVATAKGDALPSIPQPHPVHRAKTDIRVRDPPMVPQVQVEHTSTPRVVPVSTAKSDALPGIPHVHPVPLHNVRLLINQALM